MTLLPDTILICPTCELRFEMLSDDLDALPTDMPAERKRLYLSAEPADWTRNPLTRSMRKAFFPARPLGEPVTRRHDNPPDVEEARAQAYLEAVRFLGVVVAIPMFLVFVNYYLPNVFMVKCCTYTRRHTRTDIAIGTLTLARGYTHRRMHTHTPLSLAECVQMHRTLTHAHTRTSTHTHHIHTQWTDTEATH